MPLTPNVGALLGLTAMISAVAAALTFAILRFAAAARDARRNLKGNAGEVALLSAALQEAVAKLKAQERATVCADALRTREGSTSPNSSVRWPTFRSRNSRVWGSTFSRSGAVGSS